MTNHYDNIILLARSKNKPNSNPIKPNLSKAKNEIKLLFNKGLQKLTMHLRQGKTKPILTTLRSS
jgi:hypothetical protein